MGQTGRTRRAGAIRAAALGLGLLALPAASAAAADSPAPALTLEAQATTDFWRDASGGKSRGDAILQKFDVTLDWSGDAAGRPGWSARLRAIATNADYFSEGYVGDLQTLSNIEGDGHAHAFEAWAQRAWGDKGSLRAGFLDLNTDFDSIATAGLFLNSSHGIGPDLSQSGVAGPSIFPVTALGARAIWTPSPRWTLMLGAYDGLPGRYNQFVSTSLSSQDGATVIGEADYRATGGARIGIGAWAYTAQYPRIEAPASDVRGQAGAYAFVDAPLPGLDGWNGWIRVGRADPTVSLLAGYMGAGVASAARFLGRPEDHFGLAVAHAIIGGPARQAFGLRGAETSFEATYQAKVTHWLSLQPDVQYILDPGGRYANALVVGLRVVVTARTRPARE